jgi:hypothetical protein
MLGWVSASDGEDVWPMGRYTIAIANGLEDEMVNTTVRLLTALKTILRRDVSVAGLDSIMQIDCLADILDFVTGGEYVHAFRADIV